MLYVPPKMTKTEVKEYLTKIYNVSALQVMTSNFLGNNTHHSAIYCCIPYLLIDEMFSHDCHWLQENGSDSMAKEKSLRTSDETLKKPW